MVSIRGEVVAMSITRLFKTKSGLGACAVGLCMLMAQPCFAQQAACVNLLWGSGYAAWMGVRLGDSYYWSSGAAYPVGEYRCVRLPVPGMVDGAPYSVVVSAALGRSKVPCSPEPARYHSNDSNSVSYNAWGTTLDVKCQMPLPPPPSAADQPMTPSKEPP